MSTSTRPTLTEIANLAGTSAQVASAVLGGGRSNSRFSEKTRQRVEEVANTLGYRPNRTGRTLRGKRHGAIAVLCKDLNFIPRLALRMMMLEADRYDQVLVLESLSEKPLPRAIREDSVDGILLFENTSENLRAEIERYGIPYVEVNTSRRFVPHSVTFDEEGGIRQSLQAFADHGCKELVFIGKRNSEYWTTARRTTFLGEAAAYGIQEPELIDLPDIPYDERSSAFLECLANRFAKGPGFDGLFLDMDEYPLVLEALRLAAVNVPVLMMGYRIPKLVPQPYTGIDIQLDRKRLAEVAMDLLNRRILGESLPPEGVIMPYTLRPSMQISFTTGSLEC